MPTVKNMDELAKYVNELINKALNEEVKEVAVETMQYRIQKDVYEPYKPYPEGFSYQRTGELLQDVQATVEGNTLTLEDTRSENGRDIVKIIEDGGPYDWGYTRNLDQEIGERPFVANTFDDLEKGLASEALIEGLKRQGLDIK